jgi:hypothetical protein
LSIPGSSSTTKTTFRFPKIAVPDRALTSFQETIRNLSASAEADQVVAPRLATLFL